MLYKLTLQLLLSIIPYALMADTLLAEIENLKIKYNYEKQAVTASWNAFSQADKYSVEIKDSGSNIIFSKKTTKTSFMADDSLFIEGNTYNITIRALRHNAKSRKRSKKYRYTSKVPTKEIISSFVTQNSGSRSGTYFLPENYRLKPYPLMLIFHGSNIDGARVVRALKKFAREYQFIIAAPDSTNPIGWYLPSDFDNPTVDQIHIYNILNELHNIKDISIDTEKTLIAGVSAGGAMAGFFGSNDSQFKNIAVQHGGIKLADLGQNMVRVWLSTGSLDTLRPPAELLNYKTALEQLNFPSVEYHEYNVAHSIPDEENTDLINWWLNP